MCLRYNIVFLYYIIFMVHSKLSDNIHYKERREIEETDRDHLATIYEYEIMDNGKYYSISLGQENTTYAKDHIYFFHIYLVSNDKVKSQIGVVEYRSSIQDPIKRLKHICDSDGDIDINKLESPLFYSFVKQSFLDRSKTEVKEDMDMGEPTEQMKKDADLDVVVIDEPDPHQKDEEDEDDVFVVPKNAKRSESIKSTEKTLKSGIFETYTDFKPPKPLEEETLQSANELHEEFRESPRNTWIETFMKNNEFGIVETVTNGDCFFDTVIKAYEQIGQKTTPAKLRAILAAELTEDIYKTYRELYVNALAEKDSIAKEQKLLKKEYNEKKAMIKKQTLTKPEQEALLKDCTELKTKYEKIGSEKKINQLFLEEEYEFMSNVDSIDKLREVIQTTRFYANDWAIFTLERVLNVKMIIMGKSAFESGDIHSVLNCGTNDEIVQKKGFFKPDYYIMTGYTGNHYELVSYKNKYIFTFPELPFHIKTLIVNKCLERNSGPFYLIEDVRNFNSKLGIESGDIEPGIDDNEPTNNHLYDHSTVFEYHPTSDPSKRPGKGNNEKIDERNLSDYKDLQKHKNWRRMLDDYWPMSFRLDDQEWETVEHYYQAAKFKNKHRDFYLLFTTNSDSPFAKDPKLAKVAGSKKGSQMNKTTKKIEILRDANIKIDPDFYGTRHLEERQRALYAKFSQHAELKEVLLDTKKAKLMQYVPKNPAVVDTELMNVRNELVRDGNGKN